MSSKPISRRKFLKRTLQSIVGLAGATSLAGVYSRWIEPYWIDVTHVPITLAKLPPTFNQLRIVHISDLHIGFHSKQELLLECVSQIQQLKPDVICFTGDLLDHSTAYISDAVELLSKLQAPLGRYAVLGNHDAYGNRRVVTKGLQDAGFQVLHNEHTVIKKGNDRLYLAGVDDPWTGQPDIHKALLDIPEDACTILLAHEPDFADEYSQLRVDLQLSGHSHGGQVRIPFIGALYTPPYGSKYTNGLYRVANSQLQVYTTRGIGMTRLPVRFNCRPELTVITLKA